MRRSWAIGTIVPALAAAAAFAHDEVHVAKGPLPADEGGAVEGYVFVRGDVGERPLTLRLVRRNPLGPNAWAGSGVLEMRMNDGDAFRFEGLVPGRFELVAAGEGLATTTVPVEAFMDSVRENLHVPLACTARVRVALAFEGRADDAWVDVVGLDGIRRGGGRPVGGVLDVADLPPGRWWICAGHAGEGDRFLSERVRETSVPVDLGPGTTAVDVTIPEAADVRFAARSARAGESFEGVVRCHELPAGRVEAPFRVAYAAGGAATIAGMRSFGQGLQWQAPAADAPIRGLSKGVYTLTVDALGFAPWEQTLTVGAETRVEAVLTPLPGRYVTVAAGSMPPGRGALQVIVRPESGGPWTTLIAYDGNRPSDTGEPPEPRAFLPPGRYVVSGATTDGAASAPQVVDVTDDRTTVELSFPCPLGRTLRGRTTTRAGEAVGSVVAYVFARDGDGWRPLAPKTAVSAEGAFEVRGLGPGTYRLAYDAAGVFPLGQFDVGDADVTRAFIVSRRPDPSAETGAPEHVVLGSLPAAEGYVVAGAVVGGGDETVHLQLARMETDRVCQHACAWGWRAADLRPGERFRFVGVPPGQYLLWTDWKGGRLVEAFDVFADRLGHEFRLPAAPLAGSVRPGAGFEGKGGRMMVHVKSADRRFDASVETAPRAEFATPPLPPGRHAVEVWWIEDDGSWWDDARRWIWLDVGPETKRLDVDFVRPADVKLSVRSAGRAETFEGTVADAELPGDSAFPFRVQADGARTLGTCQYERSVFGAAFGPPREYVWLPNLPRGPHRLRFAADGFETVERTVDFAAGIVPLDVEMQPVPGTFVVAEGPGHLFEVFVRPAAGGAWRGLLFGDNRNVPTHTNPMRPRELLVPGKWEFMATTADLAPSPPKTLELGADHAELVVALECVPGNALHATLRTPSGVALADTETCLFVRDGGAWRRLRAKAPLIDERGEFEIRGLAPGSYLLAFDEAGEHVAGEFEIGGSDLTTAFVFRRP